MKVLATFPKYTAGHSDFTNRSAKNDGQVLVLDVDVDALPLVGILAVSDITLKKWISTLGWKLVTDDDRNLTNELDAANSTIGRLEKELAKIKRAVAA